MSENRFQDCHTVAQALRRYRDMEMVDADDDFELTVRLYQLAPKVPRTVTAEQRERAVPVVMAAMREAQERGTDILSGNRWLDRIIDALGWTAAATELELDLTALDHIRGVLARYENLRAAMVDQPMFGDMPDITIPGDLPMRITMDDNGVSVLRIGGCDE